MSWVTEAAAVFVKEWVSEWRTRVSLSSVGLFAACSLTLIALALRGGAAPGREAAAALLWIVIFFTAATGLGRSFVHEEERGTALALRLSARATAVWAGKYVANATVLTLLTAIASPMLVAMLGIRVVNVPLFFFVLLLGVLALAAVMTLTAALVAQATARSGLLAALSFPVLAPVLLAGVHGVEAAMGVGNLSGSIEPGLGDLQVLGSYVVVAVTASLMLFDFVWND
ncbi:MAG: heme exporter protein CcmB [Capsulimonadaceae bacterium]|nr:heme exporter protein CcmB [Capsulimonadaceae bacterium]